MCPGRQAGDAATGMSRWNRLAKRLSEMGARAGAPEDFMRTINLVGIGSMALMLAAMAFSAGCKVTEGDGVGGAGGAGGEGTTSTTSTGTTSTGGEGGSGEGGSGACLTCRQPLLEEDADPEDLCEDSVALYIALTECICRECAEECAEACDPETDVEPSDACGECGFAVATEIGGACEAEGNACLND